MSNKNEGGPAFPSEQSAWRPDKIFKEGEAIPSSGMTLRDYFAGQALSGIATNEGGSFATRARWSYQMADAMLKARDL